MSTTFQTIPTQTAHTFTPKMVCDFLDQKMRLKFAFKIIAVFTLIFLVIVFLFNIVAKTSDENSNLAAGNDSFFDPFSDSNLIFNANDSRNWIFGSFVINNSNYCRDAKSLQVLVIVHSSVTHFAFRDLMRKYVPSDYKPVFVIGQLTDLNIQAMVVEESKKYGDIVQGSFYDSYRNLTLKHIIGFTWTTLFCSQAEFVLKVDDDIFVNFPLLNDYLETNYPKSKSDPFIERTNHKLIACYVQRNMKVIRDKSSKWFVTREEYKDEHYPDFCSGWAYFTTPSVIRDLLNQLPHHLPPFWIDDVYVTGILRKANSDVSLEYLNKWFNVDVSYLFEWIEMKKLRYKWRYMFSNANGDINLLEQSYALSSICSDKKSECFCCFPSAKKYEDKELKPVSANGDFKVFKLSH